MTDSCSNMGRKKMGTNQFPTGERILGILLVPGHLLLKSNPGPTSGCSVPNKNNYNKNY